jgi:hypothetical protein
MKTKLLALALVLTSLLTISAQTATAPAPRVQWEYKSMFIAGDTLTLDEKLTVFGEAGWELVSVIPAQTGDRAIPRRDAYYYFKKAK